VWLYPETITTGAILHGDRARFLAFDPAEHPVALQLGGSDPADMAACAVEGERAGYDEINMNVGCPSDRTQSGRMGACLMGEFDTVAKCVEAMRRAVDVPVTVKTRIGIDDHDSYEFLADFVRRVADAGCETFIVHARKAWLSGLSPKENREVPPLRYDVVHALKVDFPQLRIELNGGLTSLDSAQAELSPPVEHGLALDGAMLGRAAYDDPYLLASLDRVVFGVDVPIPSRDDVVLALCEYVDREVTAGAYLSRVTRHIMGLYRGLPNARAWRRYLGEASRREGAASEVLRASLECFRPTETSAR
jgi:tRNA-dihydrouridine synthase A